VPLTRHVAPIDGSGRASTPQASSPRCSSSRQRPRTPFSAVCSPRRRALSSVDVYPFGPPIPRDRRTRGLSFCTHQRRGEKTSLRAIWRGDVRSRRRVGRRLVRARSRRRVGTTGGSAPCERRDSASGLAEACDLCDDPIRKGCGSRAVSRLRDVLHHRVDHDGVEPYPTAEMCAVPCASDVQIDRTDNRTP
jgi:hypothetical protein